MDVCHSGTIEAEYCSIVVSSFHTSRVLFHSCEFIQQKQSIVCCGWKKKKKWLTQPFFPPRFILLRVEAGYRPSPSRYPVFITMNSFHPFYIRRRWGSLTLRYSRIPNLLTIRFTQQLKRIT